MTENEVVELIYKIAKRLASKFTFGSYDYDDVVQEAVIIGMAGLEDYVEGRPVENFLWVHMRNRLCNFKRKKYCRLDSPCKSCPLKAYIKDGDKCKIYEDKSECELFRPWFERNETKKNLAEPSNMGPKDETQSPDKDIDGVLDNGELLNYIDGRIPVYMRSIWLRAKGGGKVTAEEMRQLKEAVLEIMGDD